jgi:hypothetical protein
MRTTPVSKRTGRWPLPQRVEVEFEDACASGSWRQMADHRKDDHPSRCRSIGYLLEKTRTYVTVAQSQARETQNVSDTMSIPRGAIVAIRKLR